MTVSPPRDHTAAGPRPTTDDALALDLRQLARSDGFTPGRHVFSWPVVFGEPPAIAYVVDNEALVLDYPLPKRWHARQPSASIST